MRYFIYLSYDGARYHGWQIQPNGVSVQEVLQQALSTLLRQPIEVVGAGRTDAGVNASMMVAHFGLPPGLPPAPSERGGEGLAECHQANKPEGNSPSLGGGWGEALIHRLNRLLPPDIAVQRIVPVTDDAHARFSATSRTYHYYITTQKSAFHRHYAYHYPLPLDIDRMNEAASRLFDYTDFTSFSKLHTDVKTNNCKIMQAKWEREDNGQQTADDHLYRFTITADRFLRNMVRAIVGTLLDVGRGKITIEEFCKIIEKKDRCSAGSSVPGNALFLANVTYPDEIFLCG